MPIERCDILFFFPEVQFALQRIRHAPGAETIPRQIDECAIIEAMHTRQAGHAQLDQRARMLSTIDSELVSQSGVIFRASRNGDFQPGSSMTFFVLDQIMRDTLVVECGNRGIMLPAAVSKKVIVDLSMVGLRVAISEGAD